MRKPSMSLIAAIIFALTTIAMLIAFIWAYMERDYYRNEVGSIVNEAVEDAKDEQYQEDEGNFAEEYKKPHAVFTGPSDFGSVSFEYPKTWASYNDKNDTSGFSVYFYPTMVPTVRTDTAFALRLNVVNQSYNSVLSSYDNAVTKGELTATPITTAVNGLPGMRLDGQLAKNLNGSIAIFRVRDKTLTLQVDSQDFMADFNNTILPTLTFIP